MLVGRLLYWICTCSRMVLQYWSSYLYEHFIVFFMQMFPLVGASSNFGQSYIVHEHYECGRMSCLKRVAGV